jgi:hypothetical protein
LGTSNGNLRKWARRRGLLPEPPGPGQAIVFTADQVQAIRAAWQSGQTRDTTRPGRPTPETCPAHDPAHGSTQPETRVDPPGAGDDQAAAGWQQLVAELRAERDRLRSQLDVEQAARQRAERALAEAERGRAAAELQQEALRGAAWRWVALCRRPLWRLRPMPDPPPELGQADRLLTG